MPCLLLAEAKPAYAGVDQTELVPWCALNVRVWFKYPLWNRSVPSRTPQLLTGGVDALDQRQPEVPLERRVDEGSDEAAARLRWVRSIR